MDEQEKIGYKRPPKEHQFKKGQSGNARGRPKKDQTFKAAIEREFKRKRKIKDGETIRLVTMAEIIIKTLINKALSGNHQAINIILKHFPSVETEFIFLCPKFGEKVIDDTPLTPEEEAQLQSLYDPKSV